MLKTITELPRYTYISRLHSELKVDYIKDHLIKTSRNFYDITKKSIYDLTKNLCNYEYVTRDKRIRPKDFLDII